MMSVYKINPLSDLRWPEFIQRHPQSSVFHTPAWLQALSRTYGYEPVVYTTTENGDELTNGILFCRVRSWLTGKRLVSLPFSDHCEILVERPEQLEEILRSLQKDIENEGWKYIELRPLKTDEIVIQTGTSFKKSQEFHFHELDLRPELDEIYKGFHPKIVRYVIRRAEREDFLYERGNSEHLLRKFYHLQVKTRRKHQIPPQPLTWFRNLIESFPETLNIQVISDDKQPLASTITILYKDLLVWKYSCSDPDRDRMGLTKVLVWKSICQEKENGACTLDMGRSDLNNPGLLGFKEHFGSLRSNITYYRYPVTDGDNFGEGWIMQLAKRMFARVPDWVLTAAGKMLYRHKG